MQHFNAYCVDCYFFVLISVRFPQGQGYDIIALAEHSEQNFQKAFISNEISCIIDGG